MPIPLKQRGQPIVRPCSLTRASVTHQRFCVAASSDDSSLGASSMLTFGLARVLHCRSNGKSQLPITVDLFGLKGSPVSLSTYSLLHLADSGCHLIVQNLRTPCSSPHKCSSVFSVLPNQTSSSPLTSNLPRSSLVPKHFKKSPPVGSYVVPAEGQAAVSYRPAHEEMVSRLQPASNSRFSRVLHCAYHLSQGPACSFHWRTLQQSSLLASRLNVTS